MSDPDSKKPSIPSWQQRQAHPTPSPEPAEASPEQTDDASAAAAAPGDESADEDQRSSKEELLRQAERFLQDEGIQDAPIERKRAFLEAKGVKAEDVAQLLDAQGKREIQAQQQQSDSSQAAESAASAVSDESQLSQRPIQPAHPARTTAAATTATIAPPIVTYPEFLTQPTEAPPLVTVPRIVNTAYIAGGLCATLYGLSKFLVAPMVESLSAARHDFAAHTQEQLDALNLKLVTMVSADPAASRAGAGAGASGRGTEGAGADEGSETDEDPTELFHRDCGTQTTPNLSRRPSVGGDGGGGGDAAADVPETERVAAAQAERLKIMTSHLQELAGGNEGNATGAERLKSELGELQSYLNEMRYKTPAPYITASYGIARPVGNKEDDAVESLRADIRGVKGVLLSARNFPAGGPGQRTAVR